MPKHIFRIINTTIITVTVGLLLSACGSPPTGEAADTEPLGKPEVITTVGMIADVAQNVARDCAVVTPLTGPGTDPHTYRASARDSRTLGSADLILYSGYALEGEFGELLGRIGERRRTVAVAETAIPKGEIIATDTQYGVDPHVWMDVAL